MAVIHERPRAWLAPVSRAPGTEGPDVAGWLARRTPRCHSHRRAAALAPPGPARSAPSTGGPDLSRSGGDAHTLRAGVHEPRGRSTALPGGPYGDASRRELGGSSLRRRTPPPRRDHGPGSERERRCCASRATSGLSTGAPREASHQRASALRAPRVPPEENRHCAGCSRPRQHLREGLNIRSTGVHTHCGQKSGTGCSVMNRRT